MQNRSQTNNAVKGMDWDFETQSITINPRDFCSNRRVLSFDRIPCMDKLKLSSIKKGNFEANFAQKSPKIGPTIDL